MAIAARAATPLKFESVGERELAEFGATATEIAVREIPPRWIVESWHRLGVRVLADIVPEPYETPEFLRRRAGFSLHRSEIDGFVADENSFSSAGRAALAAARKDAALAARADRLALGCLKSGQAETVRLGRKTRAYLYFGANLSGSSSAQLSEELLRRIGEMERALGVPASVPAAVPPEIAAEPVQVPRGVKTVGMSRAMTYPAKALPGLEVGVNGGWVTFSVSDAMLSEFLILIPNRHRDGYVAYRLCVIRSKFGQARPPRAPVLDFTAYWLQPRFAEADAGGASVRVVPTQPFSPDYPKLEPKSEVSKKDGVEVLRFSFSEKTFAEAMSPGPDGRGADWYVVRKDEAVRLRFSADSKKTQANRDEMFELEEGTCL